jgi:hypothetical protein
MPCSGWLTARSEKKVLTLAARLIYALRLDLRAGPVRAKDTRDAAP